MTAEIALMSPEQSAREARALAEIVQRINQSLELDRVFALIVRHAAELLHARGARLGLVEDGEMVIAATHGDPGDLAITTTEAFGTISASGEHPLWERRREHSVLGNVVAVPCLANGLVIGAISVFDVPERRFDTHDEELLLALANHAAIAIDNARLYRQSVRAMEHASILASSARSLAMHLTPDEIYADIERISSTSLDADGLTLYQAVSTNGVVTTAVSSGAGSTVSAVAVPQFWSVTGGAVMLSGIPRFVPNLDSLAEDPLYPILENAGVRSVAFIPLGVEGRLQGLLVLRYLATQTFDEDQRTLLIDFGGHCALALRNALLLERVEQRAQRLAAVAKVQQAISAAASLPEVYAESYRAVASIVDAPCFVLMRHDAHRDVLIPEYVVKNGIVSKGIGATCIPIAKGSRPDDSLVAAFRTGEPNVAVIRETDGSPPVMHPGMSVVLSTPIVNGEQVLGVLQAQSANPGAYDPEVVDIVMLIARQAGTAIARAQATAAERAANERARALAVALEAMDQPVLIRSRDEIVLYANGAALREYGYKREELIGLPSHVLTVLPTVRAHDHTREAPREDLAASGSWSGELLLQRKNGSEFPAWLSINNIVNDEGEITASVISTRDLTEERRVAEQLRQSEKLVALGELVAGVAHEVNNPLTGISAFAQLLQEEKLTPDQLEAAQMIKREADRAVSVIRDLLTFARKTGPRSVPIDMNTLIEQTMRLRTYGLRTAGIDMKQELAPSLPRVRGDDRQLQQVLLNLVVNAEHALANCPRRIITLRTSSSVGRVIVEVSDTGQGMSVEVQKRIFEPFFTTKPEGAGTGLGLSVSFGIVQTHGGTLTVHSAPGAGATFRLTLPVDESVA
ncbi:MAG TPA: GAF domain-containing protein [Gemmatimonadaceae bacterium]|nr:GAF domain-containing protein [Gemmatimonadaceae bacterium]